jgi:D-arginine dehydrogenase
MPIAGPDGSLPAFYWLAGQGGYGIQTAPALARLLAARIREEECPADLHRERISYAQISPERFSLSSA